MSEQLQLDHLVINVNDMMDEARNLFETLGFSITDRGYHSLGSINHSMLFQNNYLELIGYPKGGEVKRPELKNASIGINGIVFKSKNINKTYTQLLNAECNDGSPKEFNRPVIINQLEKQAKFKTISVKKNLFKPGRLYFCEHLTPNLVWIPSYLKHSNTCIQFLQLTIIDNNPTNISNFFLKINSNTKISVFKNSINLKFYDFIINICTQETFRKRYKYIINDMKFLNSMYGAIVIRVKSIQYLVDIIKDKFSKNNFIISKNKIKLYLSKYNSIIEFVE